MPRLASSPAFGQADLSNCEREQIHLAGSIQPHGALLVLDGPALTIIQASANAAAFLGRPASLIGEPLASVAPDLPARVHAHRAEPLDSLPVALRCIAGAPPAPFDGLLHRPPEGGLILELERAGPPVDLSRDVESWLQTIVTAPTLQSLADETARIFQALTGHDRVMVYRFDDEGHGEVFSEVRRPELESYLGNRYPASDIPQIARRLYERNRVRVLVDVHDSPVPLEPRQSPLTGRDLDMSLCFLRSMSPIHIQYLKNMGVCATLVASLIVAGKLWGLVACHHYEPRFVHFETRAVCELLAEAVGTRIAALQSFAQAQAELAVRRLEQRMIQAIARDGDWRGALFDGAQSVLKPLDATGAALLFEGEVLTAGEVPGTPQLREIGAWLDSQPRAPVIATASLAQTEPAFRPLIGIASGLLATPISSAPGDYLLWFRPERIRTVTWGGDPFKPVVVGNDPADLSPRRSFSQWHQVVEATSDPWTPADLTTARLIGDTLSDVVLQFHAVRMLIAHDQLAQVQGQVRSAEQPALVADAEGRILMANAAFGALLPAGAPPLATLEALPALLTKPTEARRRLRELLRQHHTWRGEVALAAAGAPGRPLLVRADPVFSAPGRVLGHVVLFTDMTERKAADGARQRFHDGILHGHQLLHGQVSAQSDLLYRKLLSTVIENAQLAALEIADGSDMARIAELLDGIRGSVGRMVELLDHLMSHARDRSEP